MYGVYGKYGIQLKIWYIKGKIYENQVKSRKNISANSIEPRPSRAVRQRESDVGERIEGKRLGVARQTLYNALVLALRVKWC